MLRQFEPHARPSRNRSGNSIGHDPPDLDRRFDRASHAGRRRLDDDHRALVSRSAQTRVESAELGLWARMDRDPRACRLVGGVGLDERLLVDRACTDFRPVRDQHCPTHALEPPVLQFAATRLGSDRDSVSLAFDRRADVWAGATFLGVKLVARAVPALGDIRRISQSYDRSIEWCFFPR